MSAQRAYEMGMVNKVVPLSELESSVMEMASKISAMPRLGLTLTKQAINHVEDLQGKRNGMEAAFAWHHFSHAHNDLTTGNVLAGFDAKKMAKSQRKNMKKMSKQQEKMLDKLTEMDGYANEDVRLTMIDSVVTSLKKGIYPTKVLSRVETLINKHQAIKAKKQRIKKGF